MAEHEGKYKKNKKQKTKKSGAFVSWKRKEKRIRGGKRGLQPYSFRGTKRNE
jgi:AMMECR1 domain-containing protein